MTECDIFAHDRDDRSAIRGCAQSVCSSEQTLHANTFTAQHIHFICALASDYGSPKVYIDKNRVHFVQLRGKTKSMTSIAITRVMEVSKALTQNGIQGQPTTEDIFKVIDEPDGEYTSAGEVSSDGQDAGKIYFCKSVQDVEVKVDKSVVVTFADIADVVGQKCEVTARLLAQGKCRILVESDRVHPEDLVALNCDDEDIINFMPEQKGGGGPDVKLVNEKPTVQVQENQIQIANDESSSGTDQTDKSLVEEQLQEELAQDVSANVYEEERDSECTYSDSDTVSEHDFKIRRKYGLPSSLFTRGSAAFNAEHARYFTSILPG